MFECSNVVILYACMYFFNKNKNKKEMPRHTRDKLPRVSWGIFFWLYKFT